MVQAVGSDQIREAIQRGALSIPDEYGCHHGLMAACPNDGHDAPVYRTERSREAISRVIFRCPVCATQFDAQPEQMFVRN